MGAALGTVAFSVAVATRAVPAGSHPAAVTGWGIAGLALLAGGGALWFLTRAPVRPGRAFAAAGAGLALALVATVVDLPAWRSIVGDPDNAPARYYQAATVEPVLRQLVTLAAGRPVVGIYLSNHYESSVMVLDGRALPARLAATTSHRCHEGPLVSHACW